MWQVDDPEKWARFHSRSHTSTCRVEVWSGTTRLTESAEIIDGAVTDDWVIAGVRRSLQMTVPNSRAWRGWLAKDSLEVRPYLGVRYSARSMDECPMGRFPVSPPDMTLPSSALTINANAYADSTADADFVDTPVP